VIATETRQQAIARMAEISEQPQLDVRLVLARPRTIDLLYRQALRKAAGDELLLGEVCALLDVAKGRATALIDTVYDTGLPTRTAARGAMSLDEFEQTVMEVLG
jgi:hypothetical protein